MSQYQPKNPEKYKRMRIFLNHATGPETLKQMMLLYVMDMSYAREDILHVEREVMKEKGWKC